MLFSLTSKAQISNNIINSDQTVCNDGVAFPLRGTIPDVGTYSVTYLWIMSNDSSSWTLAPGQNDLVDYFMSVALVTYPEFYFRRIVYAGPNTDTSNTVTIHVLLGTGKIMGNSIGVDQSLCYGQMPAPIGGGVLSGGSGSFFYMWLKSSDFAFQNPIPPDGTYSNPDYIFPHALSGTEYYIRIVAIDTFMTQCPTPSNIVQIEVHSVTNNMITNDQNVCFGDSAMPLSGPPPSLANISSYAIEWQQSPDGTSWTPANGINSGLTYYPGYLTNSTCFRRRISADFMGCGLTDTVSNMVCINLNPPITGNFIFPHLSSDVCSGNHTLIIGDTALAGGDGFYSFHWEMSLTGLSWQPATGIIDKFSYLTGAITSQHFFRRIVYSGGCSDTSNTVVLNVISDPPVLNNLIYFTGNLDSIMVCAGNEVGMLNGTIPSGGNGAYEYHWWRNPVGFGAYPFDLPPSSTNNVYIGVIDTPTVFHRIVFSGACHDYSNFAIAGIRGVTNNYISADQTICYGASPDSLYGIYPVNNSTASFEILWEQSTDSASWSPASGVNNHEKYSPGALIVSTFFRRKITDLSAACSTLPNISNVIKITTGDQIGNNLIYNATFPDNSICYNTITQLGPNPLNPDPTGGDGYYTFLWQDSISGSVWQNASGINNFFGYQTPSLIETTFYRRIVYSCGLSDISPAIQIKIDSLPEYYLEIDDSICVSDGSEFYFEFYGTFPWEINFTDGINNYSSGPQTYSPYYDFLTPTSSTSYTILSVSDGNGCFAASSGQTFNVIVFDLPVVDAGSDTVICGLETKAGLGATLSNPLNTGEWSSPDLVYFDNIDDPHSQAHVDNYGIYMIKWLENNGYCFDFESINIHFIPELLDSINYAGIDQYLDYQSFTNLNATLLTGYTGEWAIISGNGVLTDSQNPKSDIINLEPGYTSLTWTQSNNYCGSKTDTLVIELNSGIVIPDGFSPNGDAYNDFFVIKGLLDEFEPQLFIFNRWGNEVISFEKYKTPWDGTNYDGIALPDDTYYYILKVNQGRQVFKGYVIIKR